MTTAFTAIDLSQLPVPDALTALDADAVVAAMVADFQARYPAMVLALESDPIVKLLETAAYHVTLVNGRINDAVRAVLLASTRGADMDAIAPWWGVSRQLLVAADPLAVPPVAAVYESDEAFRARIQLSPEAHTTAGSIGAYQWHAKNAAPTALDVGIASPTDGTVLVSVLGSTGTPSTDLLSAVAAALNAEEVRPLCDTVQVQAATLLPYTVTAQLHIQSGPSAALVLAAAQAAVTDYTLRQRRLGARIARSALYAALQQPGVEYVALDEPAADIEAEVTAAPWPGAISVTVASDSL